MKISIIIPTYNAEAVIERTLQSVFNQAGDFDLEVIVADDCSRDRTREIAADLGAKVLSWEKNSGGPNKGRNIGLEYAEGDYICLLDQDDIWYSTKLQKQVRCLQHFDIPVCFTEYEVLNSQNNRIYEVGEKRGVFVKYPRNEIFRQMLQRNDKVRKTGICYLGSIMFHRNLKDIRFEENFGQVDFDWLLNILQNRETAKVSEILMQRNVSENNLSLKPEYRAIDYYYSMLVLEKYEDFYPNEVKLAVSRLNGSRGRYYYAQNKMPKARRFLRRASLHWKTAAYLLTSFCGSTLVKKYFRIFG